MADEPTPHTSVAEKVEGEIEKLDQELEARLPQGAVTPAPGLLPGELTEHPSPFRYVMIAVVLVVVTALEVGVSYLEGTWSNGLIIFLLIVMAVIKFFLVASWYMHLRTDQPIFRRFFVLGIVAAILLYTIVLLTLHVLD